MWTNKNSYRENNVWHFHVKYFTSLLFYIEIFYDWKHSMKLLRGKQELASQNLGKYSTEYLTTETELVLPSFKS